MAVVVGTPTMYKPHSAKTKKSASLRPCPQAPCLTVSLLSSATAGGARMLPVVSNDGGSVVWGGELNKAEDCPESTTNRSLQELPVEPSAVEMAQEEPCAGSPLP